MKIPANLTSSTKPLDMSPAAFGELRSSADARGDFGELRRRFAADGYLYVPQFFDTNLIDLAREEIARRMASMPPIAVSALVRDNAALRGVVYSTELEGFYEQLLGGPVRHYDHIWLRVIAPGPGTPPHCDIVYMGRGTHNVMTAWIPYRQTDLVVGGLMILEKSHALTERLRAYLASDADTYCENRGEYLHKSGYLSTNPVSLREKLGGRWLTAEFRAGDLLTFGMNTVHASLDNQSTVWRLSSDTRYQLATEPIDPRWVGPDTEEYAVKNRAGKIC